MMGLPSNSAAGNAETVPQSPAIPSDYESDIPSSPIAALDAPSSEFGSTPAKSYTAFPRTPGSPGKLTLEPPSSRLRHSITMRKAAAASSASKSLQGTPVVATAVDLAPENLSFDMGEVEMLSSGEHLNQLATPFAKTGQVNYITVKEQEKIMDEIKKENFDLKLRVSLLQERLSRLTPESIEGALAENVELKVQNEALVSENRTYKSLVNEAHGIVEQLRMEQQQKRQDAVDAGEVVALRAELEQSRGALAKTQVAVQRYESQLSLFDRESREGAQRVKQLELDLASAQNRLSEANNTIARHQGEIAALEEELATKSDTMRKFRDDISASTSDMGMFRREMQELQDRLKRAEEEKEQMQRERDSIRKTLERNEAQLRVNATLSSPVRNSLDVLESKLLKELGQAHKRVTDLEKQSNMSQGERDQLMNQSRRTGQDLMIGIRSMQVLAGKIAEVAFPGREMTITGDSLNGAVEVVEGLCREVLVELEDARLNCRDLEGQVRVASEGLAATSRERDTLAQSLSAAEMQVQKLTLETNARGADLRQATEAARTLQARLREATEQEMPRLQREAERATERVRQLTQFAEGCERQLANAQMESDERAQKHAEAQQLAVRAQTELAETRENLTRLVRQRDELAERLGAVEAVHAAAARRIDELQSRAGHSEKVKSAVEEQFNRELKTLHAANGELKSQLAVALNARSELTQRVDRLSQLLREAERAGEDGVERMRNAEASLAALRREHEILLLEHKTAEAELVERQGALARLEHELARLRREDLLARRTTDGLEHLQAKVESLTAMNNFLKDQTDTRERTIRALEDRLRHQQEEMRQARDEVDQQARKLKKREQLISQALKRLESINHMRQAAGGSHATHAMQSISGIGGINLSASPFRDDHHPSLTPTRPTKRPNTHTESFEF